jgi:transposase InsO family protein
LGDAAQVAELKNSKDRSLTLEDRKKKESAIFLGSGVLAGRFSRSLDNLRAALALHFAYYNLCRIHGSLRITPAMAAGITDHVWPLDELIGD